MFDCVIVGGGVAGLYTALHLPSSWKIAILCKGEIHECNTYYAQGGVTTARNSEDIPLHIQDTLSAGCFYGNQDAIQLLSQQSLAVIRDLIQRGMPFDCDEQGNLVYTKEAAHSTERILHAQGDATGKILHQFLLSRTQATLIPHSRIVDWEIQDGRCLGLYIQKGGYAEFLPTQRVVLASGGVGALYAYHTNATPISGDIQGMAARAGLPLKDMAFTQFHPTVFVDNPFAQKVLLSEALRGEGATIVDETGERFVFRYDQEGELAPRDRLTRAIFLHKRQTNHTIYLSTQNFKSDFFASRFPNISHTMKTLGFHLPHDLVPISPAFHYIMGGIQTDLQAKVIGYDNIYAVGEVACTGVHGANRLASNSLLEGLVFALTCAKSLSVETEKTTKIREFKPLTLSFDTTLQHHIKNQLRQLMWNDVGILRTTEGLHNAFSQITQWEEQFSHDRILLNSLACAKAIVSDAINRPQSLGSHTMEEKTPIFHTLLQ